VRKREGVSFTTLEARIFNKVMSCDSYNTVRSIHEALIKEDFVHNAKDEVLPYTTVASIMKKLERMGAVSVDRSSKTFVIKKLLSKRDFYNLLCEKIAQMLQV